MKKRSAMRNSVLSLPLMALLLATTGPGAVQTPQPQPKTPERVQVPNEAYSTPEKRLGIAERLDRPNRDQDQKPEALIAALGLKPGDRVADVGVGTGYLLPYLSRAVSPGGVVYAEDIFPDFLDRAKQKAEKAGLQNVRFVLGDERNPKLPAGEMDLVVMLDAYHHFEYPKQMLDNIRASLKPEGRMAIVDFYKRGGMADHMRLDRDAVAKEVEGFGWKLAASPDALPNQYILIFERLPQ